MACGTGIASETSLSCSMISFLYCFKNYEYSSSVPKWQMGKVCSMPQKRANISIYAADEAKHSVITKRAREAASTMESDAAKTCCAFVTCF